MLLLNLKRFKVKSKNNLPINLNYLNSLLPTSFIINLLTISLLTRELDQILTVKNT
jgi:hypothetical protein